jgi:hypothetical protein
MADLTYMPAAQADPKPLPSGANDYGPLAYVVWIGGGILILACLLLAVRTVLRLRARHARRAHGRFHA